MQYLNRLEEYHGKHRTAVTLGKFDGFHRGHQKLLAKVREYAREYTAPENIENDIVSKEKIDGVVFTFDMTEFRKSKKLSCEQIMLCEERMSYLEAPNAYVDYLIECPFNNAIRHLSAENFISEILVAKLHVKYLVVGSDFHFGFQAKGDVELLRTYSEHYDYQVIEVTKEMYGEQEISSTYIREELIQGHMHHVNAMLGYLYSIDGVVVQGQKLGRQLGFPTMNIVPRVGKILPLFGVYMVQVEINQKCYGGVANIGRRPTVLEESDVVVEVNVFDYEGNAYGERIQVHFLEMVRREKKFQNIEELKEQIRKDRDYCIIRRENCNSSAMTPPIR